MVLPILQGCPCPWRHHHHEEDRTDLQTECSNEQCIGYGNINSAMVPLLVPCQKEHKCNHQGDAGDESEYGASPCTNHSRLSVEVVIHHSQLDL
ncbi:Os05g0324400 [Oryza sativa Japonica Group]|uniref:Os05g0324400 protein n=2 Tax=Oryza sativa subsp. japonica TaxID=39947 RepID=A0A0P0WKQ2_ORYSJ|nr:unknown protein [Oryza sativa Japonica Group]KAB8098924.1 hypothetical protein EE612_028668 [Oryza sativa]BAF17114.1 Os05g0324400 [Oryza sativa Japonica Group]BAS93380.1 Os05g0324400 [Oryza sativa Japonica Group]|eukprot:NP_001055200.1 Os05g0324400 [Oryza sativa Japonica Group]